MTTAQLTAQRMDALHLANEVRISNAQFRLELAALSYAEGCERVARILENPQGPAASMPIGRLLRCIHRVGESGMATFLRYAGIFSTTKRVRALTPRQRQKLAAVLRNRNLVYYTWDGFSS